MQRLFGEGHRFGNEIALDDRIDQSCFKRLSRAKRPAADSKLHRGFDARQSGRAAGAASARNDAERHLRQSNRSTFQRNPEPASHRHLEAAAKRGSVNGRDPGLFGILDPGDHVRQMRLERGKVEFAHIRPGNKGPAGAGKHHGLDRIVAIERIGG